MSGRSTKRTNPRTRPSRGHSLKFPGDEIKAEVALLREIEQRSHSEGRAYSVSPSTGTFLKILAHCSSATRVLELGLGFGGSAIYLSKAIGSGARIDSIELLHTHVVIATNYLKKAKVAHLVRIIEGDALTVMPKLSDSYDLIFLDTDLAIYPDCLSEMIRLTKLGGIIVSENLWDRETALALVGEEGFLRIQDYVSQLFAENRLLSTTLGDGLALSLKVMD